MDLKKIEDNVNYNLNKIVLPEANLIVGENYPYEIGDVGALLELLDGGYYYLKLVAEDISEELVEDFLENDIEFKAIMNKDKVYLMVRFGEGDLLYEIFFDPTLYDDRSRVEEDSVQDFFQKIFFIGGQKLFRRNYAKKR